MKQAETLFKTKKRYLALMILCFFYGGFTLIMALIVGYSTFWRNQIADPGLFQRSVFDRGPTDANRLSPPDFNGVFVERLPPDPFSILTSPPILLFMLGGVLSIFAGLAIWNLMREKEIKKIREETANHLLLPEELQVLEALKKSNMESTQSRITTETGLSRVQVHRVINRLEAKGILEKHKYGLTNKIVLKKEIFE